MRTRLAVCVVLVPALAPAAERPIVQISGEGPWRIKYLQAGTAIPEQPVGLPGSDAAQLSGEAR